jgi:hypothetical protein
VTLDPEIKVWRYMSFAKLVWLLQNKQLWFSSAELLSDEWEVMPIGQQLNAIINSRPQDVSADEVTTKTAKVVTDLRNKTFVNCWTASDHESHALWRIYCPNPEGVAIRTSLKRLKESIGLDVMEVSYISEAESKEIPTINRLVSQKRPMFSYEQEVRIVLVRDFSNPDHPDRITIGAGVDWDPELHLEGIWVHPEAKYWFIETVTETVRRLAPKLSRDGELLVWWSKMKSSPPF